MIKYNKYYPIMRKKLNVYNKNYLNIVRPKLISSKKNRPSRTKFKGPAEDIFKDYAKFETPVRSNMILNQK